VKPVKATPVGRLDAVAQFEQAVGHPLDLVHVYHPWSQVFPDAADVQFLKQGKQLMISWSGTSTSSIVSGLYDDMIRTRAEALKALGSPVLLRWRWEMNRPNLTSTVGSAAEYVQAWKHIRTIFDQVGATNVGWVWCPLAGNFTATNAAAYYPGDDQVDWLCADVYAIGSTRSFADVATDFMTWAAAHPKPIVIGEYGSELADPAGKQSWIQGATAYAKAHSQIKAMVYFDAQRNESGKQRDFRVESAPGTLAAFTAMLTDPWFRQKG
jgi:beta-mannanase